ncbi:C39 family peptidase [Candidatus Roizmanbacteria bacterium]|nr:C39 family peptidase [Candidatus Roizmanbacteria bacterium]
MFLSYLNSIRREIQASIRRAKPSVNYRIPYVSQFESKELVDEILSEKIDPHDDPLWKRSGAKTKEEYAYWSHNTCGIACLKMVLKYKLKKEIPIVHLAKKCTEYGGYILKKEEAEGLFYEPFCQFVKKEFDMNASVAPFLTLKRILFETGNSHVVIASVSPEIRNKHNNPKTVTGGHLVVVTGYDAKKKRVTIHNPSGLYKKSQENYEMKFEEFEKFFAGRGIVIYH